jgi:hypothetical protein
MAASTTESVEFKKPRWIILRPQTERRTRDTRRYDPTDNRYLRKDRCFLCGRPLTRTTRTTEHVFPKWLLNEFHLWNQSLVLLNGTAIPYRKVRIPCCRTCNGTYLAALERRVESAVHGGYRAFRRLPRGVVFQWLTKIFFQILYLETRLAVDVKVPARGTILTPEFVEEFRLEHLLLNSVRIPVHASAPPPWSIFVVPTQTSADTRKNFDFLDNVPNQVVGIRMNDIAIIAVLMDANAQGRLMKRYFHRIVRRLKLHPIQFRELAAKAIYARHLMNRTPKFTTIWNDEQKFIQMISLPLAGFSAGPIFDPWKQSDYARVLQFYAGVPFGLSLDQLHPAPNTVATFLHNARNRFARLDIDSPDLVAVQQIHAEDESSDVRNGA